MKKQTNLSLLIALTVNIIAMPTVQCGKKNRPYRYNQKQKPNKEFLKKIQGQQEESRKKKESIKWVKEIFKHYPAPFVKQAVKVARNTQPQSSKWKNNKCVFWFILFLIITSASGTCLNCEFDIKRKTPKKKGICCPDGNIYRDIPYTFGFVKRKITNISSKNTNVKFSYDTDYNNLKVIQNFSTYFKDNVNTVKRILHDTKNPKVANWVIQNGADVNAKDDTGSTPLHYATNPKIAALLIQNNANVNAKDNTGSTPLHYATNPKIADLLIQNSANVNARNNYKKTPADTAEEIGRNHRKMVDHINKIIMYEDDVLNYYIKMIDSLEDEIKNISKIVKKLRKLELKKA